MIVMVNVCLGRIQRKGIVKEEASISLCKVVAVWRTKAWKKSIEINNTDTELRDPRYLVEK